MQMQLRAIPTPLANRPASVVIYSVNITGGLVQKKTNLTQQKHAFANQKKRTTTQNKHKKLKPDLVAFYDIRPGNGAGQFSNEKKSKRGGK